MPSMKSIPEDWRKYFIIVFAKPPDEDRCCRVQEFCGMISLEELFSLILISGGDLNFHSSQNNYDLSTGF